MLSVIAAVYALSGLAGEIAPIGFIEGVDGGIHASYPVSGYTYLAVLTHADVAEVGLIKVLQFFGEFDLSRFHVGNAMQSEKMGELLQVVFHQKNVVTADC